MSTLKMVLHVEKTLKTDIQKNLSKSHKYLWRCFVIVKPSFALHSNFTYDFEDYDLMKLYLETLLEILVFSQCNCTHCILFSVSPNFLYSNRLN